MANVKRIREPTRAGAIDALGAPLVLRRHPAGSIHTDYRVSAGVDASGAGRLALAYVVEGDIPALRLSQRSARPERTDGLWRTTCFEAFVRPAPGEAYVEINASTSGDWASYAFDARRSGRRAAERVVVDEILVEIAPDRVRVAASVETPMAPVADVGLCVVLEGEGGGVSHWALDHGAGAPDFHDPLSFAHRIIANESRS
ncbi:MAG: DOMON-like domain-containing protein [Parvularculaceae bacterium]